jgi:hypothetical protein
LSKKPHLEDEFEKYLSTYNDEFDREQELKREIEEVSRFIYACRFEKDLRVWKNSDLFTLLVETHRAIIKNIKRLDPEKVAAILRDFYRK